jgi:hypothetical protein
MKNAKEQQEWEEIKYVEDICEIIPPFRALKKLVSKFKCKLILLNLR